MRAGLAALAGVVVASVAGTTHAQQGAVQASAAAQVLTGDANRLAGQERVEPDFGVTWIQPGSRFGMFQMEVRGTERHDRLHAGRTFAAVRDARYRGLVWSVEGGDTYASPSIGDYRFTNLFTPPVTFSGAALSARGPRTSVSLAVGNATAWRNIFGTDPETLDQALAAARVTHRFSSTLDANVRASRTRTSDLGEFVYTIEASDQAGGGIRYALSPELQLIADGSFVSYRRRGATEREHDASGLVGAHWLHARGWLQLNAYRFSPGEMPTVNSPLPDREGLFVAGEYDLGSHLRVFGGNELFRTNLIAAPAAMDQGPQTTGLRSFGGVRVRVGSRSTVSLRVEDGDRISQPVSGGIDSDSDTGSWSADWQTAVGRFTGSVRYARRENVDRARTDGSFSQQDAAAQAFVGLSRSAQLFGLVTLTRTDQSLSRNTYWQAGGGGQLQVFSRNLWMRAEGNVSRNIDLLLAHDIPRESVNLGVNGQITSLTTLGVNVYLDRAPAWAQDGSSWVTRSMFRVTRSFPTAGPTPATRSPLLTAAALERGTGSVRGIVYADWDSDGVQDPDELPLEGIPLVLQAAGAANSRRGGEFAFVNVPVGLREVALDVASLPVDYDPPTIPKVLVDIVKGQAAHVAFGLIPLGAVRGRVVRDGNGNGAVDEGEEAVDGAVLVLDDGQRSELARHGRFAFEAVRSGPHRVTLLLDSLPVGSVIRGNGEVEVVLRRGALEPEVLFLVSLEKRPEIRRTFPGRQSPPPRSSRSPSSASAPASRPRASASAVRAGTGAPSTRAAAVTPGLLNGPFAVQVAALNDPVRARSMVEELRQKGYPSYLVLPPTSEPDAPFRIRVGRYASRADANAIAESLERERGAKPWVVREVTGR